MKANKFIMALALGLSLTAVSCGPKISKAAQEQGITAAKVDSVSYLLGINFGSMIKQYGFGELNYAQMIQGMKDFVAAKGNMRDTNFVKQFKVNPEEMGQILDSYLDKMHTAVLVENTAKQDAFFAENIKKAGVDTTASKLQYIITEAGNQDLKPAGQDTTWVYYTGKLTDGTVFDSHTAKDGEPVQFFLNMIPGWNEGIQLIGEGGKITLFIPSQLGYGEYGQPQAGIDPNSPLIFDIELVKVGKFVETEPAVEETAPAAGKTSRR